MTDLMSHCYGKCICPMHIFNNTDLHEISLELSAVH